MRPARIGLFVHDGRLTVVAITGRGEVEHVVVEEAEDPAGTLAAELQARGLTGRRLRVGLDRRAVVVKAIELPRTAGSDVAEMVAFDLERHVPFAPEDVRFDWLELPSEPDDARRVLVVAAERRAVERPLGAARRGEVAPDRLDGRLPRADRPAAPRAPGPARGLGASAWRGRGPAPPRRPDPAHQPPGDRGRGPKGSRGRSSARLGLVRWTGSDAVWLSGDDAAGWRDDLAAALGLPVSPPPYAAARVPLISALPAANEGPALLALGVAEGRRTPALNLLPVEARPWTPSREQLVTAGTVAVTALLALGLAFTHTIKVERHVGRLTQEIHRLEPEAKVVEGLAAELARKRRILSALDAVENDHIRALPVLQEMTETLPAGSWLQALTMDRQGVELTGQSDTASALIPLLEGSPRLERVEFTSPVTKTQNKEQFRIRAGWEGRPAAGR